jgi:hypothetical protein
MKTDNPNSNYSSLSLALYELYRIILEDRYFYFNQRFEEDKHKKQRKMFKKMRSAIDNQIKGLKYMKSQLA